MTEQVPEDQQPPKSIAERVEEEHGVDLPETDREPDADIDAIGDTPPD